MSDLTSYSDADLKGMYLQSLSDSELTAMHPQAQPNSWGDLGKSLVGGVEKGAAAIPMVLPNMINSLAEGGQEIYRGMTGRDRDFSPMWKPFYGSNDVLEGLAPELQPHIPQSPVGVVGDTIGQFLGGATGSKVMEGAAGVIEPFSQKGREAIANRIITQQASDPVKSAATLQNIPQYVPGSPATGGTASGDLGLIGMEKTLVQNPANYFGDTLQAQNTARTNMINRVSGDESTVPRYEQMRTNATDPLYTKAMDQPVNPDAIKPVIASIDKQIAEVGAGSDAGKILLDLKSRITGALPNMEAVDTGLVDAQGIPITKPQFENVTGGPLTQIYKETRDQLQATGLQPGALASTVRGVVKPVNKQLGEALEAQNPTLAQANDLFAKMSVPITQAENMQTLTPRMTGGTEDLQGQNIFSPAKVGTIMKNGEMKTEFNGAQPLNKALSPEQYHALKALNADLQRSNAINIPMVRPPGSNTFSNEASTAALTKSLAGEIGARIPIFKGLYNAQQPKIMDLIASKVISPEQLRAALLAGAKEPDARVLGAMLAAGSLTPPMPIDK